MEDEVRAALFKEKELPVVCIWGKSGMGKTTLAENVFYDEQVRHRFEIFAWVPIKHNFQTKNVLQNILLQLVPDMKADIGDMDEIELAKQIFIVQKNKRCLVVLEDICAVEDWRSIKVAFPIGKSISKILISTPLKEVAEAVTSSKDDGVYGMRSLTQTECFKALEDKATFDKYELQMIGDTIFKLSGGSPLLAVILGRSLKTLDVAARDQLPHELASFETSLTENQISGGETKVLGISYRRLPPELKQCLLYMGQYPEGQHIQVEKLYLLLTAEKLITSPDKGNYGSRKTTSMESVTNVLDKLADKMLVQVKQDKLSSTRMYKYCLLHDQIRDFCRSQGKDDGFFEIVDFKSREKLGPSTRRLAIYLNEYEDGDNIPFSNQDMAKKILSLLIFDTYEAEHKSTWPSEINDLKEFICLEVLDFDGVDFKARKFPKGTDKLVLLKYLGFRGCFMVEFPSSIIKFQHLETLDLRVHRNCKMTIPNVLHKMRRLKHLYFPTLYESLDGKNSKLQLDGLGMLEILVNFDTVVCKVMDLSGLKNLQILATISHGHHKDLEDIIQYLDAKAEAANYLHQSSLDIRNFDCYTRDRVTLFKKLLECKSLNSLRIEGQIGQLPEDVNISPNFTEMVFDGAELELDPMNILGKLQNLRSLVLSNDAFVGNEITFLAGPKFPNLRILKLHNLQYLEKLTFEKGATPELSTLVIENCGDLEKVLMPKALDSRLKLALGKKGDDVYSVEPFPTITDDN